MERGKNKEKIDEKQNKLKGERERVFFLMNEALFSENARGSFHTG